MAQVLQPSVTDVLQFMTHNDLELYKRSGSAAPLSERVQYRQIRKSLPYKKGIVFVSPSKDLLTEGKGYIVTSYESLHNQYNQISHWTPNTFRGGTYYDFKARILKGHSKDNLKQINVIGFDIDTKRIHPYEIFLACDEVNLPRPNLILETPKGYQGFFVLETPFFIHAQEDYKALRVAERLANNILAALKKVIPVDLNCNPFGFYRMPNDTNIKFFDDEPANTNRLLSWSMEFEKKEKKAKFHVVYGSSNAEAFDMTSSEWYLALIHSTEIHRGHYAAGRNNALLTLAIANYASGKEFEEAYDELDQFNSNLEYPLSKRDFHTVLRSAYSGKYKGPKREYVEGLLNMWTDGSAQFRGREGWYKFKKPREARVRSHYEEREQDILEHLKGNISPETPFLSGSLRELSERFGMALSTLKEVLKRSGKLVKRVVGSGRNAITMLTTRIMLFKSLLRQRKQRLQHSQITFGTVVSFEEIKLAHTINLPDLDAAIQQLESSDWKAVAKTGPPLHFIS